TRIIYVAPWHIGPDDVPPLNLRRDRLGHTNALAQFLNGDQADNGDQWREFSEEILVHGHWPIRWFDAWLAARAHGEGLYGCLRGEECRVIRVRECSIEQRSRFEPWVDVRPENRRIKRTVTKSNTVTHDNSPN